MVLMTLRGWCRMQKIIKIKDAFVFLKKSKIKAGDGLEVGKYPFYTSSSVLSKYLDSYEIEEESLIFGTGGSASVHHSHGEFSSSTDCFVVQSNNKYEINLRYVYLFLSGNIHILENGFKGAGLKHISKKYLEDVEIPLPSLETQMKIVEVLDKAQGLIDARKEQIRMMDGLIQSVFYEMFGDPVENSMKWPLHFLSELCKVGSSKRIYKNEQTISGIPFLRISDLMNRIEVGAETCDLFISSEKFEELKEKGLVPKVGEILVTSRGTLGECYIVNDDDNFYFQDGMISWLSNISDLVLPKYLLYLFKTQGIKRQIDGFQAGSTVAYLSITMLKQLEIMLPPIELQNQFISFIQQVDRLKIHAQKSLDEILGLFDSLIQRYFE